MAEDIEVAAIVYSRFHRGRRTEVSQKSSEHAAGFGTASRTDGCRSHRQRRTSAAKTADCFAVAWTLAFDFSVERNLLRRWRTALCCRPWPVHDHRPDQYGDLCVES